MKKSLIIMSLAVFMVMSNGICQAKTDTSIQETTKVAPVKAEAEVNSTAEKTSVDKSKQPPKFDEKRAAGNMQPPPNFDGKQPPKFGDKQPPMFGDKQPPQQFQHPSREEMDKKKAEFEKRLNLTDKQKKKIEENRIKDREKIKPVFDQMNEKKQELEKVRTDNTLSQSEKVKKEEVLKKDIGKLRKKVRSAHEKNMKNFESVLNKNQKQEFSKIKKEQRQEMGKHRPDFEKSRRFDMPPHHFDMEPKFPPAQQKAE